MSYKYWCYLPWRVTQSLAQSTRDTETLHTKRMNDDIIKNIHNTFNKKIRKRILNRSTEAKKHALVKNERCAVEREKE